MSLAPRSVVRVASGRVCAWSAPGRTANYLATCCLPAATLSCALAASSATSSGCLAGALARRPCPRCRPASRHRCFADSHPAFQAKPRTRYARAQTLRWNNGRYVLHDHLLAANWSQWCRQPLDRFAAEAYGLLGERRNSFPSGWLESYPRCASMTGSARIARCGRSRWRSTASRSIVSGNPTISVAAGGLEADYAGFAADFAAFFRTRSVLRSDGLPPTRRRLCAGDRAAASGSPVPHRPTLTIRRP